MFVPIRVLAVAFALMPLLASANQEPAVAAGEEKPAHDVRKLFANSCSYCHGGFGMTEGKGGPKLAGTKLNAEQVKDRIAIGKSGAMPGFNKTLKEDQIQALVDYIKGLPAE